MVHQGLEHRTLPQGEARRSPAGLRMVVFAAPGCTP